jgi:hypothetical protein
MPGDQGRTPPASSWLRLGKPFSLMQLLPGHDPPK